MRLRNSQNVQRSANLRFAVMTALILVAFAWVIITMTAQGRELRAAREDNNALARQVQQLGGTPVAGEPGSRGKPGPTGESGKQGEPGRIGPTGPVGPTGPPGTDGTNGIGQTGAPGSPGVDGQTVVGPQGPAGEPGPAGPQGEQGAPGEPGADGQDGADGTDGQACPTGYSWQTPSWDPDALICRRDGAPEPKPGKPGLLSAALDPSRRQYP